MLSRPEDDGQLLVSHLDMLPPPLTERSCAGTPIVNKLEDLFSLL